MWLRTNTPIATVTAITSIASVTAALTACTTNAGQWNALWKSSFWLLK